MAIFVGAVVRGVWVLILHPPLEHVYSDMEGYVTRAVHVATGASGGRPDALYPPMTHLLLSVPLRFFGTGRTGLWAGSVLWFLLSASIPVLLWRYVRSWTGPFPAAVAAAIAAFWPLHITYSGYFLSEIPATALLLAALCCLTRSTRGATVSWAVGAGVLGGMAVATRPQMVLNVVVGTAAAAVVATDRQRLLLRLPASVAAGFLLSSAAVAGYSTSVAGKPTLTAENSGMTFYLGHCDVHLLTTEKDGYRFQFGSPSTFQRGAGRDARITDHLVWDSGYFYRQGLRCIRHDGIGHVRLLAQSLSDLTITTMPWPQVNEGRLGAAVNVVNDVFVLSCLPVIGWTLWRRRGRGELVMLAHLGCGLVVATLVVAEPRFRTPYDVFAFALFGPAAAAFISFLKARTRARDSGPSMSATDRYEPASP